MKISNYFFAIIAVLCLFSCTKKKNNQYSIDTHLYENINIDDENWDETDEEDESYNIEDDDDDEDNATVYVSDWPYAHAYHYDECCYGLSNTSGDIHEMTKWEAEDEGRDECHFCAP